VYRVLPPHAERLRTLRIDGLQLIRWQKHGDPVDMPTQVHAEWQGPPEYREVDYPSSSVGAPVLSRDVADNVREPFASAGIFVPVRTPGEAEKCYELYAVTRVADCLDLENSSEPLPPVSVRRKHVFVPELVPQECAAFRLPQFPRGVYWNAWAVELLCDLIGRENLEVRLVWSTDPTAVPHHDPMGL
jgi:hypothetical protein